MTTITRIIMTCLLSITLVEQADARFPSQRPLPKRLKEEQPDYLVRRDEEFHNQFFLAPRRFFVTKQTINEDQTKDLNCVFLDNFMAAMNSISEALRRLASSTLEQARFIENEMRSIANEKERLETERQNIERELLIASESDKPRWEKAKTDNKEALVLAEKKLQSTSLRQKELESLALSADLDIQRRLETLNQIHPQIHQPVAQLRISLEAPDAFSRNDQLRAAFGFDQQDLLSVSDIISLSLRPTTEIDRRENADDAADRRTYDRAFRPYWSVESFSFDSTLLSIENYGTELLKVRDFPRRIDYERTLSLKNYCHIKSRNPNLGSDLVEALGISYQIPLWIDSGNARFNGTRLFSHSKRLTPRKYERFLAWEGVDDLQPFDEMDLGDPLRFSGEGRLGFQTVLMDIDIKKKETSDAL